MIDPAEGRIGVLIKDGRRLLREGSLPNFPCDQIIHVAVSLM